MEYRVTHGPVFSVLQVELGESEFVEAQPNSMLSMTSGIRVSAATGRSHARRRIWSGFSNMLGGENFFTARFGAVRDEQQLALAPSTYGDILPLEIREDASYYLTRGAYLANAGHVVVEAKYGGVKGVMSKKGLFFLQVSGDGTVFCQAYGAVVKHELAEGESFFVDNRYVVAFSTTIEYQLIKATESVKDALFSGEGFVNKYTGPGKLYYQTRGKQTGGLFSHLLDAVF